MDKRERDGRVQRTQSAIVQSFNGLFFERPYDAIQVSDIIGSAGIGRSTFYEHFRGKDEVLRQASMWVLNVLADGVTGVGAGDEAAMRSLLEHVRENRKSARSLLCEPTGVQLTGQLAEMIEARLGAMCSAEGVTLIVPLRVAAAQAAETQLALMRMWLERVAPCEVEALAKAMCRAARSAVGALVARPG